MKHKHQLAGLGSPLDKKPAQPNDPKSKVLHAILTLTEDQCVFLLYQAERQKLLQRKGEL